MCLCFVLNEVYYTELFLTKEKLLVMDEFSEDSAVTVNYRPM